MGRFLQVALAAGLSTALGCGQTRPPSSSPPPSGNGQGITGRERVGWTQAAAGPGDLMLFRYAMYVDGTRHVLSGDTCTATSVPTSFDCSAPLPPLTPGTHTLELAAFVTSGGTVLESPRSPPLQVTVTASTAAAPAPAAAESGPESGTLVSSDGLRLRADVVLRDLMDPVDLAAAQDGRVFVAEESGVVRIVDQAAAGGGRAQNIVPQVAREAASRLLSLALAPDFETTGVLHVVYRGVDRGDAVLRLVRLREAGGVLGEAAVLSSHFVAADTRAIVRSGPDDRLYVGVGTGGDEAAAQTLGRAGGKVLRLNRDGSIPDENPWRSAVFSVGHSDPRALLWHPRLGLLEIERAADGGDEINTLRAGANYGWPGASRPGDEARITRPVLMLPAGTDASGAAVVTGSAGEMSGDLVVSALAAEDLLHVRLGARGEVAGTSRLLNGRFGRIASVAAAPGGALYFVTANRETWGEGRDALVRLEVIGPASR